MRSSGVQLGNASGLETLLSKTQSGTKTSTTGTDNNGVVSVINHVVGTSESTLKQKGHERSEKSYNGVFARPTKRVLLLQYLNKYDGD